MEIFRILHKILTQIKNYTFVGIWRQILWYWWIFTIYTSCLLNISCFESIPLPLRTLMICRKFSLISDKNFGSSRFFNKRRIFNQVFINSDYLTIECRYFLSNFLAHCMLEEIFVLSQIEVSLDLNFKPGLLIFSQVSLYEVADSMLWPLDTLITFPIFLEIVLKEENTMYSWLANKISRKYMY